MMKVVPLLAGVMVLAGCGSPENFESTPVQVETSQGVVTCQLYTRERLDWDRSIDRPEGMSVAVADQVCKAEGAALQNAG